MYKTLDVMADIAAHPHLSGFLTEAGEDVSALMRRVRDEAGPLYVRAEQLLSSNGEKFGQG